MKEFVEKINEKHNHLHPEMISFLKVVEELGEITEHLLACQIDSRKNPKKTKEDIKDEMGSEIADCFIALISLVNDFDVDISDYLEKKMDKHIKRLDTY